MKGCKKKQINIGKREKYDVITKRKSVFDILNKNTNVRFKTDEKKIK